MIQLTPKCKLPNKLQCSVQLKVLLSVKGRRVATPIMADWEEVRQLAADFQRVQESTSAHKLSERNCIEIVTRLISKGDIQVVYTLDGKEYVTPQQLEREIKSELVAHQGLDVCLNGMLG